MLRVMIKRHAAARYAIVLGVTVSAMPARAGVEPPPCPPGNVFYVDANATGANTGTSWTNAYTKLRTALAALQVCPNVTEIWVAEGTYYPDETLVNPNGNGDRAATFTLRNGVAIIGGFRGLPGDEGINNQITRPLDGVSGRPILLSILSGDLGNNDGPGPFEDYAENSFRIVTATNLSATSVLDGLTIRGGEAGTAPNIQGAALRIQDSSIVVRNCTFDANRAADHGGAVEIRGNGSLPHLENCAFSGNYAVNNGGAMRIRDAAAPRVVGCTFESNSAGSQAGAIQIDDTSNPRIEHCVFVSNSASGGGAIFAAGSTTPLVRDSTFSNNAATSGGAVYTSDASVVQLINSRFHGNDAASTAGALLAHVNSRAHVTNCVFTGNTAVLGGATATLSGAQTSQVQCTLFGNNATSAGGGVYDADGGVSTLRNSIVWGNTAPSGAGASGPTIFSYSNVQDGIAPVDGNISNDPLFIDPDGADNVGGTEDDDLRLAAASPCIDAGRNSDVPADVADLDGDTNTSEPTPLDLAGVARFRDATCVADSGEGAAPIIDMGAHEYVEPDCDSDGIGDVCDSTDTLEITSQPTSLTVCEGEQALFVVTAIGAAPVAYQWRRGGVDLPGETASTLSIAAVALADAGSYDVVVSNACGVLVSNPATLSVTPQPVITQPPQNQSACDGGNVTFSVVATGEPPLAYVWRRNGVALVEGGPYTGTTSATLSIDPATVDVAGQFDVVVSKACGTTTSPPATLTVRARGDADCDGTIDFFDIDPFLLAQFNPPAYANTYCGGSQCGADIDCNGIVDFFDIDPFLACLFGTCPPCP